MPLSVKVENENRFLTKYLITEKDDQGEDIPGDISREQIKNKIRDIVKNQKEYSVSVLIDGRWRSGKHSIDILLILPSTKTNIYFQIRNGTMTIIMQIQPFSL